MVWNVGSQPKNSLCSANLNSHGNFGLLFLKHQTFNPYEKCLFFWKWKVCPGYFLLLQLFIKSKISMGFPMCLLCIHAPKSALIAFALRLFTIPLLFPWRVGITPLALYHSPLWDKTASPMFWGVAQNKKSKVLRIWRMWNLLIPIGKKTTQKHNA